MANKISPPLRVATKTSLLNPSRPSFSPFRLSNNVLYTKKAMTIDDEPPSPPSLTWRTASTATIAFMGLACKGFLSIATKKTEVHGLDGFVKVLEEREDVAKRERGLLTGETCSVALGLCALLMFLQFRIISLCMSLRVGSD
jgi:hypothetical protein